MKKLKAYEIRQMWLDFFKSKGHEIIPSASLIPINDPTLLWINAGVAPLKKYFDGREKPNNPRLTNAQKSIRTNDIDNVGKTARHHTFFEMLGNFSIGDYFREEALNWAAELLFDEKWFGFDKNLIYITYYTQDLDTYHKWMDLGVAEDHLIPLDGNFWEIGEGPCGPDTEIFYDRGIKYDPNNLGIQMLKDDIENDRYIEIWNIVFSQFNSEKNVERKDYRELPNKNIDTGSGLERLACIMQETETNYETDLFMPYIEFIEKATGIKYQGQMAFKVIVDHIRSITFALADGATFGNSGRGYVLRRILRRAVRYIRTLNINGPFLYQLISIVGENMKEYYPYLLKQQDIIEKLVKIEEENFWKTLEKGEKKLNDIIENLKEPMISGADVFLLYDTFGFPLELTEEIASEYNIKVDIEGFKEHLQLQKERARKARGQLQSMNAQNEDYMNFNESSIFTGYDTLSQKSKIIGLFANGQKVNHASGEVVIVSKETPFYAESGGQVGDIGMVNINGEAFNVINTFLLPNGAHAMVVDTEDEIINLNDELYLEVDTKFRHDVMRNHSATHLLNQSLRNVLGQHVIQHGSLNNNKRLRFDFNHYHNLTTEEILKIEKMTNDAINHNYEVKTIITTLDEAKKMGAQALFGEKYGNEVRMVDMDYSLELCGGTHVQHTKEIQRLVILSIESKGSGIFRIEAATGDNIEKELEKERAISVQVIEEFKQKIDDLIKKAKELNISITYEKIKESPLLYSYQDLLNIKDELSQYQKLYKNLEKQLDNEIYQINNSQSHIDIQLEVINHINCAIGIVKNIDINIVKEYIDNLANTTDSCFILIADVFDDKVIFTAKTKNTNPALSAGSIVKDAAIICGGNGGGRPDFASSGAKDITKVEMAISKVFEKVKSL